MLHRRCGMLHWRFHMGRLGTLDRMNALPAPIAEFTGLLRTAAADEGGMIRFTETAFGQDSRR